MEPFFLENKEYFLIKDWCKQTNGLVAGFTTKNGGYSSNSFSSFNFGFHVGDDIADVCKNRELLSDFIRFPVNSWVGAQQTHNIRIKKILKQDRGTGSRSYDDAFREIDGFFTRAYGVLLTLCFADCVPLYFYAPKHHAVGIAHAGWKGSVNGIAAEMVRTFEEEGIPANDISVVIGPSICENCYIVDDRVIELVNKRLENVEQKTYNLIKENQYKLDLKELNRIILINTGVENENISITKYCTSCHSQHFYSHRRDNGNTGRMMSFIGWKEE